MCFGEKWFWKNSGEEGITVHKQQFLLTLRMESEKKKLLGTGAGLQGRVGWVGGGGYRQV